jgi:hypothetical protein
MDAKNAIMDPSGKTIRVATATFKGRARPNAWFGADLRDGFLLADKASAAAVADACATKGPVTVLLSLRAHAADGERVIMHLGSEGSPACVEILQSGGAVRLACRDASGKVASNVALGAVSTGSWERWAVRLGRGEASLWKNGIPASQPSAFQRPPIREGVLVFGARPDGTAPWRGQMEGLRVLREDLSAREIASDAEAAAGTWKQRPVPPRTQIEAELVEASEPESLERLAPYTRSLAENLYKVTRVIEGEKIEGEIIVLQWIIMDGKILGEAREAGTRAILELEPADSRPELGGEHRSTDLFAPELPVFYDVNS